MAARRACRAAGLLIVAACTDPALPELPRVARATGLTVEAEAPEGHYRVVLAGVAGDLVAGTPLEATETAVTRTGGGADLQITAARSTWDLKGRTARFDGDVAVTRGDVTLRCATLEVRYGDGETVDTVVATGGVTVDRGARHAPAARAELVGKTGKITLTGEPRLSEGVNVLVGERIVLWLDDERADCEGGATGPCRLVVEGSALGR